MRKLICIGNLVLAGGWTCLFIVSLVSDVGRGKFEKEALTIVLFPAAWTLLAVWLLRSRKIWPWIANLIFIALMAIGLGSEVLRFLTLVWRAQYGDRTVVVDPSTIGIPLAASAIGTLGFLMVLVALLSLPAWSRPKEKAVQSGQGMP